MNLSLECTLTGFLAISFQYDSAELTHTEVIFTPAPTPMELSLLWYNSWEPGLNLDDCGHLNPPCLVFFLLSNYVKHGALQSSFTFFVHISALSCPLNSETFQLWHQHLLSWKAALLNLQPLHWAIRPPPALNKDLLINWWYYYYHCYYCAQNTLCHIQQHGWKPEGKISFLLPLHCLFQMLLPCDIL